MPTIRALAKLIRATRSEILINQTMVTHSALNSTNGMVYGLYHYNDNDIDLISLSVVLGVMIYHYQ